MTNLDPTGTNQTFNWKQFLASALAGLSSGLGTAGQGQGFGPGFAQGQMAWQQQQGELQRQRMVQQQFEMQRQQFEEQQRRAQAEQAQKETAKRQIAALLGGAPNNGRPGGPGRSAILGGYTPDQSALLQTSAEIDPMGTLGMLMEQAFKQQEPVKGVEIAGMLVDPYTGKPIADFTNQEIALSQAKRPVTNITNTMPPAESEFAKTLGKTQGEQAAAIAPNADKSRANLDQISALEQTIAQIQASGNEPGRLAPLLGELTAQAQAYGIDPASLGLPPNAGPYEQALAIGNKLALANIGADTGGIPANNFTESDRKFIIQIAPQISNTPQGLAAKIDLTKRVAQRNLDAETLWNSGRYEQTQAGFRQYQKDWAAYVRAHPLYTPEEMARIKSLQQSGPVETDGYTIEEEP